MKNVIEISDLKKSYSGFSLNIDEIKIPSGKVVGLIGENGAGKTTLIKLILNIIKRDSGKIKIFGYDLDEREFDIKEDIGVVLDNSFFPDSLNARNIDIIMKRVYKNWDSKLFYKYLKDFGMDDRQILKNMSTGMKKKIEIATALSHHPKLLILDEATSGLDPIVRNEILDLFLDFVSDDEHSIILSSHITSDLERISDYIIFINDGRIVFSNYMDKILYNYGILRCGIKDFDNIDKKDIVSFKKNRNGYDILVSDRDKLSLKYKKYGIDKVSLDDLMLLVIKGVK